MEANDLLKTADAAKYVSVCESYIRKLAADGVIPHYRFGARALRFRVADLDAYLERCRREAPAA